MNITIVGAGYVGLSNAVLLAKNNNVTVLDINSERVNSINKRHSPIADELLEKYLISEPLNICATTDISIAYANAELIIIATPTDYDVVLNKFDTSSVEATLQTALKLNPNATILIKSTIPIGFTESMNVYFETDRILFSPEFLREGKALFDNLYPSRIIIGEKSSRANEIAKLFADGCLSKKVNILLMNSREAEAVKLFSNTYLAMRVAYFNELDTYACENSLNTKDIISGVCLDPRVGAYYNNPSFGYGGYCLPKDTKQLLANYRSIPQNLIGAIVESNNTRKEYIVQSILRLNPKTVGIYRLIMKSGSDNFRSSAIQNIIHKLKDHNIKVIIYEPTLKGDKFEQLQVINQFDEFKSLSDVIVSNRLSDELKDCREKVYTRDIFNNDL